LAGYEPEEVVALLSCFVFQEKTNIEPVLPPKLEMGRDAIIAISDRVERIQDSYKVVVGEFRSSLKFGLVEVVYEWAKGMVSHAFRLHFNSKPFLSLLNKSLH
jgi:antiviral helicase SKI2